MLRTIRAKIGAAALLLAATGGAGGLGRRRGDRTSTGRSGPSAASSATSTTRQLQRGFKVYTEVCARCHSVKRLHFRNLAQPGGPGFPEAADQVAGGHLPGRRRAGREGKVGKRPAILADAIPGPFKNEQEARFAQNGACRPTSR